MKIELNRQQTHARLNGRGRWLEIHEDMEGEPYLMADDGQIYYIESETECQPAAWWETAH